MTLLDQIGGRDALNAAVDDFYVRVLADDRVNGFFKPIDMDIQAKRQKRFLAQLLEGKAKDPAGYMRSAHSKLVHEDGLNDAHFDAIAEHLQATLESYGVKGELLETIMGAVGALRDPVLDRDTAEVS
ncbi:MAG: group 1 truncated hemoglobin [Alphaproteobacteria bacterium]|nr:group 1 truncated hemoglobin [Alphaproteobacteria bacterium]